LRGYLDDEDNAKNNNSLSLNKILENMAVPAQRTNRYFLYDEIYSTVQLIKAIIKVYIDNTLQKDVIANSPIIYQESVNFNKSNESNSSEYRQFSQNCIKAFNIEKNLRFKILHNLLKYGDHFIELIDLLEDVANLPNPNINNQQKTDDYQLLTDDNSIEKTDGELLSEMETYIKTNISSINSNPNIKNDLPYSHSISKFVDCFIEIEEPNFGNDYIIQEASNSFKKKNNKKKNTLPLFNTNITTNNSNSNSNNNSQLTDKNIFSRILIRHHSPKNIVVLTTEHGNVLGYVEIKQNINYETIQSPGLQFASMIKQIATLGRDKTESHNETIKKISNRIVSNIIQKTGIVKKYTDGKSQKEINKQYEQALHASLGDQLFFLIKHLFIENNSPNERSTNFKKIQIRFISTERMIHFCLNPVEYFPYGTSILDSLIYPAKLYLLNQLTNTVIKISRAAVIRKWTLEII
jgi:hypothetical protein